MEIGSKAPDFTLPSTVGEKVSLSDYCGKKNVVLSFYYHDFTSVCENQVCQFRDRLADLRTKDVEVLSVSVDSIHSHTVFAEQNKIESPLLSDFNKDVSCKYDVLYDFGDEKGVSKRSVFVIDKEGIIRYKWVTEDSPGNEPDYDEVEKAIRDISGNCESTNDSCC